MNAIKMSDKGSDAGSDRSETTNTYNTKQPSDNKTSKMSDTMREKLLVLGFDKWPKVDRLNDTNWLEFKGIIMPFFEGFGWDDVLKTNPRETDVDGKLKVDQLMLFTQRNAFMVSRFKSHIVKALYDTISEYDYAYDIWQKWIQMNEGTNTARLMTLYDEFHSYKPSPDQPIDTVASHLSKLQTEIAIIDNAERPTDLHKTIRLLAIYGKDDNLKNTVEIIRNSNSTPAYANVIAKLRQAKGYNQPIESARSAHAQANQSRGNKRPHEREDRRNEQCEYCHRKGHGPSKKRCYAWLTTSEGKAS